jgi:hypothetical protein
MLDQKKQSSDQPLPAMASGPVDRLEFKDFILCKALDVISGNCAYRKYLHQCHENGEEWAAKVSASVARVSCSIKELQSLVDRVRRLPNSRLGKVCGEIVSSMHSIGPPRRRTGTGARE